MTCLMVMACSFGRMECATKGHGCAVNNKESVRKYIRISRSAVANGMQANGSDGCEDTAASNY